VPQALAHAETLLPAQPPGRLSRKARHFLPQIISLRDQGYTLAAIQQALAAAGVHVSLSTVRREAVRAMPALPAPASTPAALTQYLLPAADSPSPVAPTGDAGARHTPAPSCASGKDSAAAYVDGVSANPLMRAKDRS